jgi:hypothetical protein
MTIAFRPVLALVTTLIVAIVGCGKSQPATAVNTGPPPPPVPAPEPMPAPPPPKPQPDPYEIAVREIVMILQRYNAVYAEVRDEASADKALAEIGRLTARLRELAAEIAKMPYRSGQEKHTLALQTELTRLSSAQLSNPDMQRVLADPDLQLKFVVAHQSFASEGVGAILPAILSRQPTAPPTTEQPQTREGPTKP